MAVETTPKDLPLASLKQELIDSLPEGKEWTNSDTCVRGNLMFLTITDIDPDGSTDPLAGLFEFDGTGDSVYYQWLPPGESSQVPGVYVVYAAYGTLKIEGVGQPGGSYLRLSTGQKILRVGIHAAPGPQHTSFNVRLGPENTFPNYWGW